MSNRTGMELDDLDGDPGIVLPYHDAPEDEPETPHSPTPWTFNGFVITDAHGILLMDAHKTPVELDANARLIVQCVNAAQVLPQNIASGPHMQRDVEKK